MAPVKPRNPDSEPAITPCPDPRATISGTTAPKTRAQPVKVTVQMAVTFAASRSCARVGQRTPARNTTPSTAPTRAVAAATDASSARSTTTLRAGRDRLAGIAARQDQIGPLARHGQRLPQTFGRATNRKVMRPVGP